MHRLNMQDFISSGLECAPGADKGKDKDTKSKIEIIFFKTFLLQIKTYEKKQNY